MHESEKEEIETGANRTTSKEQWKGFNGDEHSRPQKAPSPLDPRAESWAGKQRIQTTREGDHKSQLYHHWKPNFASKKKVKPSRVLSASTRVVTYLHTKPKNQSRRSRKAPPWLPSSGSRPPLKDRDEIGISPMIRQYLTDHAENKRWDQKTKKQIKRDNTEAREPSDVGQTQAALGFSSEKRREKSRIF